MALKNILITLSIVTLVILTSCENKFHDYDTSGKLEFSSDTISFDTVFTDRHTITGLLKIYNRNNKPLNISTIQLEQDDNSRFTINVDGENGTNFSNIRIESKDSLMVFIKFWSNKLNSNSHLLISDNINFTTNKHKQKVKLLSYAVDPIIINKVHIAKDTIFSSPRPYHIKDTLWIDNLSTLTLAAGTKMYFSLNAALIINGNLDIEGDINNRVILTGDCQGYFQKESPGQWEGITWKNTTKDCRINYAIIKKAKRGVHITQGHANKNKILIENTEIKNINTNGLEVHHANLVVANSLISKCGYYNIFITEGGKFEFIHCTITNLNWNYFMPKATIYLNNQKLGTDNNIIYSTSIKLTNSIIYGRNRESIALNYVENALEYKFTNCILRMTPELLIAENIESCLFENPKFLDTKRNNLTLTEESSAINRANTNFIEIYPNDINGTNRMNHPDIGVYEFQP